ncbi:MAG: HD domain-containing protein [Candidatus Paceibacterota bacterium]|jgi:uncharacterized protein
MQKKYKDQLIKIAQEKQIKNDPSHDFNHVLRVLHLAEKIGKKEKADLEVVIPAAIFHDVIVYQKNTSNSLNETDESAKVAEQVLSSLSWYPKTKIDLVKTCIQQCSFRKGIISKTIEGKVLQDADGIESTGAISILRTFSSGGQMNRGFYHPIDPFRRKSIPPHTEFDVDLFFLRLLKIYDLMRTGTGKKIAKKRHLFLIKFLKQVEDELRGDGVKTG